MRYPENPSLVGQKFGRLTVKRHIMSNGRRTSIVICDCDCGNTGFKARQSMLKNKNTKSCGCLVRSSKAERLEAAKMYGSRYKPAPKLKNDWDRGALVEGKWMTLEQIAAKEAEDKARIARDEHIRKIMDELDEFS